MQVFGEGGVFEGVVGAFEGAGGGGVEVLELGGEAHAYFERVGHCVVSGSALVAQLVGVL